MANAARYERPITPRERQVLLGIVMGERRREIAQRMGIVIKTYEGHLENAKIKLGARTVSQAACLYLLKEPQVCLNQLEQQRQSGGLRQYDGPGRHPRLDTFSVSHGPSPAK